jgi:hypothetical protein
MRRRRKKNDDGVQRKRRNKSKENFQRWKLLTVEERERRGR